MKRKHIIIIGLLICVSLVIIMMVILRQPVDKAEHKDTARHSVPSLINQKTLSQLHQKELRVIDQSHLVDGVIPPTNTWFSGFALQKEAKPGFSYPNSYRPLPNGFEMGLPTIQSQRDSITGPHHPDVVVTIKNAANYKITRYDELTVDIGYYDMKNKKIATLTIGSGLPYAFLWADDTVAVSTSMNNLTQYTDYVTSTVGGKTYGIHAKNTPLRPGAMELKKSRLLTLFSAPTADSARTLAQNAGNRVTGSTVTYTRDAEVFKTDLTYHTATKKPTMLARLPHHGENNAQSAVIKYQSIFGDLPVEAANSLSYQLPAVPIEESLDVKRLSDDDKKILMGQLQRDVQSTQLTKPDTYFGGKQLQRAAQLLDIAAQLDAKDQQADIQAKLKAALTTWLSQNKSGIQSFYYDKNMHGIVGNEASFGADKEFNDHHFHYGYFIYAASLLSKYDNEFRNSHIDLVNLLVADIANYRDDETLPLRRNFDAYAGHGWASGNAPFNDGNNQESTSEAINAWTAVALWGKQINNQALQTQAQWMLSHEVSTAKMYWLQSNSQNVSYLRSYTEPLVSITWGGKREYKTFFSNEPNAKAGIQVLPLNPTMKVLLPAFTTETLRSTKASGMFGDYIMMAQSEQTIGAAQKLTDSSIDDGNSRTYLYAWMMTR